MADRAPLSFDPIAEARRQWADHGLAGVAQMSAATAITRAHQIVVGTINQALKPFDLTFARFEALRLLSFTRAGQLPLGKMGARLMVHPTSITNAIDRLEADGLVERVAHPRDRRTTLARITPEGRAVVEQATAALIEVDFGVGALNAQELTEIDSSLAQLRSAAGDYRPAG